MNWRVQFKRHPVIFLGAALTGGFLLSSGVGGRRNVRAQRRRRFAMEPRAVPHQETAAPTWAWNHLKAGLIAALTSTFASLLGGFLHRSREGAAAAATPASGYARRPASTA